MFSSLSRAAADRPRGALAAVVVAAVALGVLAAGAPGRVGVAGLSASGSESDRASSVVRAALGHDAEPDLVLVTRGAVRVRAPAYGVALRTIATQLRGDPAVAAVQRGPIGRDGRSTAVAVFLRGEAPARERAVGRIQRNLDPGPLRVLYGGRVAVLRSARDHVRHELGRLELLVLPLTLLVLVLALGARIAVGPILAGTVGVLGAVASLRVAAGLGDPSILGVAPGGAIGLAVGLDSSLGFVARYREESWAFGHGRSAAIRAGEVAGPGIALAAVTGAAVASLGWLVPLGYAHSMAISGAVAALLAALATLVAMPAVAVLAGPGLRGRPLPSGAGRGGRAYRLVAVLTDRPAVGVACAVVAVAGLLALAFPALRLDSVSFAPRELPRGDEARRADARLTEVVGRGGVSPLLAVGAPRGSPGLAGYAHGLERLPGVTAARVRTAGREAVVVVGLRPRPGSVAAQRLVRAIRVSAAPLSLEVGGESATALDSRDRFADRLPLLAVLAVALVFAASTLAGGSPPLAGCLAIASLLPAAAVTGLLVLVFGDGRLSGLIDYVPAGAPHLTAAVAALLALVAISAARSVSLAAASSHERRFGSTAGRGPARAAALTLPGQTIATVIVAAAAGVLAGSLILPAKEFGLAVAAGVILDLFAVRALMLGGLARIGR